LVSDSTKTDLLQGTLDLLILKVLAPGPMHGYAISQRIQQVSSDMLQVQQGSLYPALHRLERRKWVSAEWAASENNRRAKYYRLTAAGRRQLEEEVLNWERISLAVSMILEKA
jgi:PadR family transcriptional regulator PadR